MPDVEVAPDKVEELLRLKRQFLMPCAHHFYQRPPAIVAGEGCWLIDDAGNRYLDCYSGVTVMSAGHGNREIIEPVVAQIRTLQHTTSIYLTEPMLRLVDLAQQLELSQSTVHAIVTTLCERGWAIRDALDKTLSLGPAFAVMAASCDFARPTAHATRVAAIELAQELGYAASVIRSGDADALITGGADACATPGMIFGFSRMRVVSTRYNERPAEASRPFDRGLNGTSPAAAEKSTTMSMPSPAVPSWRNVSPAAPPVRLSLLPFPVSVSAPPPPDRAFTPASPVRLSLPLPPVAFSIETSVSLPTSVPVAEPGAPRVTTTPKVVPA